MILCFTHKHSDPVAFCDRGSGFNCLACQDKWFGTSQRTLFRFGRILSKVQKSKPNYNNYKLCPFICKQRANSHPSHGKTHVSYAALHFDWSKSPGKSFELTGTSGIKCLNCWKDCADVPYRYSGLEFETSVWSGGDSILIPNWFQIFQVRIASLSQGFLLWFILTLCWRSGRNHWIAMISTCRTWIWKTTWTLFLWNSMTAIGVMQALWDSSGRKTMTFIKKVKLLKIVSSKRWGCSRKID